MLTFSIEVTHKVRTQFAKFLKLALLNCVHLLCLVTQLGPTLCDPMNYSPPSSSVHGILQARILEWVAMPFSRGSSQPRDQSQVSRIAGRFFTV